MAGPWLPQNPGIGGLDELTTAEELFVSTLAGLSYSDGDILYYDSGSSALTNLGVGSNGDALIVSSGVPAWSGTTYLKLDTSNDPLTGNLTIQKDAPQLILDDSGDTSWTLESDGGLLNITPSDHERITAANVNTRLDLSGSIPADYNSSESGDWVSIFTDYDITQSGSLINTTWADIDGTIDITGNLLPAVRGINYRPTIVNHSSVFGSTIELFTWQGGILSEDGGTPLSHRTLFSNAFYTVDGDFTYNLAAGTGSLRNGEIILYPKYLSRNNAIFNVAQHYNIFSTINMMGPDEITITDMYDLYISDLITVQSGTEKTITNRYGVYIEDQNTNIIENFTGVYSELASNSGANLFINHTGDAGSLFGGDVELDGALNHDGSTVGFYGTTPASQATTGIAEATFVENAGGTAVNVDSTFGGYTIQQVVQALQTIGILA